MKINTIILLNISICIILLSSCYSQEFQSDSFAKRRDRMVLEQIELRGINDRAVLNAMRKVPRHKFVPDIYIEYSYNDYPLPIGEGQTISQPYIVAFMTDELKLEPTDKVLEIGTGSGYQAAVLAEICDTVYTIEIFESLGNKAKKLLRKLNYENIKIKIGDGYKGWLEFSPFDVIIVTCSPTEIPQALIDQLKEGGRMIIPVGTKNNQNLVLLKKKNGKIKQHSVLPVRFVPMINESGEEY
ncbi:MAG: protein-L-isoaspartate(D-aspartate) O-methyltransferase [Bacteroidales bacterium]|nr:protein-L-isoaspartate(D-aspartate) O-methyltransferase [Bacteroidales bacterium]